MSGGTFARVLAAVVLVGLLIAIGAGVYNAGLSAGMAQNAALPSGAPTVVYAAPYAWHGWGWGWGFGIFGIFFWILGIFLIFGLLRFIFGWGRWGGRGYRDWSHGPNRYGQGGPQSHFDEWHRRSHESGGSGGQPGSGGTSPGSSS